MDNITTKYILTKYNITRQTLYNWISSNKITEPRKDWRGWRVWDYKTIEEIDCLINNKTEIDQNKVLEIGKFNINNRRYLGSKYKLLDFIYTVVNENCENVESVADIFGGTGVVANMFYNNGKSIIVNDLLYSNVISYKAFFDKGEVNIKKIKKIINDFNNIKIQNNNYFSENFGGAFFTNENAIKIGYIRDQIENLKTEITEKEYAVLLTSLIYATDKVANTCGHYDAYREVLDTTKNIKLLIPDIINNKSKVQIFREDANQLVRRIKADLTYIDTPYNSRQYGDAYHLLENLAEWKKPNVVGKAKKMTDRAHIKSKYCTVKAPEAFEDLIKNINSKYILVSYNNMAQKGVGRSNAKISGEEIIEILSKRGKVKKFEIDYNAFTTGKTNIDDHKELLYLCTVEQGDKYE